MIVLINTKQLPYLLIYSYKWKFFVLKIKLLFIGLMKYVTFIYKGEHSKNHTLFLLQLYSICFNRNQLIYLMVFCY